MNENQIISVSSVCSPSTLVPLPRIAINVRVGVMSDIPFLDSLQKLHTKQVGWMPTKQFEAKIEKGHVLVAEDESRQPVGYCIGNDQYFKRDDVGIIYQMNVLPGKQRGLIGANLLQAMFERAAYGCKLFCCWCAQDIQANHFWESMGFVALAFRTGSAQKSRIHIFWQKRIRSGDTTTPYWFPSQTSSGAIREDRLVLPIPPGTHWSDAKPLVLPGVNDGAPQLEAPKEKRPRTPKVKAPVVNQSAITGGGMRWGAANPATAIEVVKQKKEPKPKVKNDPKLVAAARELRDRWLEKANEDPSAFLANGKYEVSRAIADHTDSTGSPLAVEREEMLVLPAPPSSIAA